MKAFELYSVWTQFESMMESPSLTDENKLQMGVEWVRSLPPEQLCVTSSLSYRIVKEAMQGRLNDLKNGTRTKTPEETCDPQGKEQKQGRNVRQKPIRKAKQNP